MYEVYKHTSPSGRSYIGYTRRGWRTRLLEHKTNKKVSLLSRAIKKYGLENIKTEILGTFQSEFVAGHFESDMIKKYKTRQPNGYNISSGGVGNTNWSDEQKQRLSDTFNTVGNDGLTVSQRSAIKIVKTRAEIQSNGFTIDQQNGYDSNKTMKATIAKNGKTVFENRNDKISKTRKQNGTAKGKNNPMYGKIQEQINCPHCGKIGDKPNMTRWHLDNCKQKDSK